MTKPNKKFTGIVFGIVPEFQGKGVDAYLINEAKLVIQPMHQYEEYEMQWIGEFNPKMINLAELTPTQLQSVAFFNISHVCSWSGDKMIIKPVDTWTEIDLICAEITTDEMGQTTGVTLTDAKLAALQLLAP